MATTMVADFAALEHFLESLNANGIDDVCAILPVPQNGTRVFASVWFAYCDQNNGWFVLNTDPSELVLTDALGFYVGMTGKPLAVLGELHQGAQFDVLHPPIYEEPGQ